MSDETVDAIREVTALLRERIGQGERMLTLQEKHSAKVQEQRAEVAILKEKFRDERPQLELPQLAEYDSEQHRQTLDEIVRQGEQERAERRAFQESLLSEMARHTQLLERIAARLEA